ncbi:bifunctional 6-phosphofructo-2-kinase/fructose-2,6-bisphosphate 2-phosphatase [Coniochaeta ligniaria NRRL 30616]|uniref:Bifunctional 6-phosphofructo-2-kinase/fructose-2,6-bisphosphate 2-phosphatase n=1 Tax=Coniochaeta ligniaria NRRL 30616 TaxID=1408157 RepID=A0A1J7JX20_9PEZI|nr:bifunctional 6-phosphofructo-2-kinase/fructose-2,6-bisphosphate 2-phosphatase [Coniochaeta ligniaria NRRL 30616]
MPGSTLSGPPASGTGGGMTPRTAVPKLVIIMVGLPARGKSYIVRKLCRYLNWLQYETRVFNVGERRRLAGRITELDGDHDKAGASRLGRTLFSSSAAFFDPTDPSLVSVRDDIALETLDELLDWLSSRENSSIGILDATNSTRERRERVLSRIRRSTCTCTSTGILFLESCCFDRDILDQNFRLKLQGPDYRTQDPDRGLEDFRQRVAFYEKSYVPLGEAEEQERIPYLQVIDVGRKINTHLIQGFLSSRIVEYMLNFNLSKRQIWIFCGGESTDDSVGRIGRPSDLTEAGRHYAASLVRFIHEQREQWEANRERKMCWVQNNHEPAEFAPGGGQARSQDPPGTAADRSPHRPLNLCIWTSTMPQTVQTVSGFSDVLFPKSEMKMLDDLNAGDMAGLTFDDIAALHPAVHAARKQHKLLYRWPGLGGECYLDLIERLRPVILELERRKDHLLVVTHRAVVRVLLSYFLDLRRDDLAEMVIPKNWGFLLEPAPYGIEFSAYSYQPVSGTFRLEPEVSRGRFLPGSILQSGSKEVEG